jgi:L-serine dehydratase
MNGGSPEQVAKAVVLALSPTIGVPCTPRVSVAGLCATHIGGAVLIGNLAAKLALRTTVPLDVEVDVMIAMAAAVHTAAAPSITTKNIEYLGQYFRRDAKVEEFVSRETREEERKRGEAILVTAREEIRRLAETANPIHSPFAEPVVGGSSIAVGSPTNMGRIAHELVRGQIRKVSIGLTVDLFARRAINVPGILMGAVMGAATNDVESYKVALDEVIRRGIEVKVYQISESEVQRIAVTATERDAFVDSLNRGGARIKLVNAEPSLNEAIAAAGRLGIKLSNT